MMGTEPHLLVIDDEPQILRALRTILTAKKFRITTASRGEEGLALATAIQPDLVILDLGLPDISGFQVCSRLREWSNVPIIVLSVREGEQDKVAALDQGADDYLVKPFAFAELLARLRVLTRKKSGNATNIFTLADLSVNCDDHTVTRGGQSISLTLREFAILEYMIRNKGVLLTREQIERHIWNFDYEGGSNIIDVYIRYLRRKIDAVLSEVNAK